MKSDFKEFSGRSGKAVHARRGDTDANNAVSQAAKLLLEARKENKDPVLIATGPSLEYGRS
uniref:hypothetical protein n=1 Tax=Bradyrhizobium sp. TaxID=376 RepID=UPI0007C1772A|nr:hypothetical protein [Bradyrhizobium sp.]CUT16622.1 hypothetical protein CDS [Bradyrhizobium sp.]